MLMSLDIIPIKDWLTGDDLPLVISGPCSAETEEQVLSTAREVAGIPHVKVFRAGLWKPRTRPGGFQGVGERGLEWMKSAGQETGLLTTVEVANPGHIEKALKYGIDILWIGARTVVNPFSIQEICDVLKGVDIPVMVKNPVNPDIRLWIGALERLNQSGINKLIAVHRGFFYYQRENYRNSPMWEIPIELKRLFPNLPVICDPSHICGKRENIHLVAQKAMDMDMAGLMIETHIRPQQALTDAAQQISPAELRFLIDHLVIRKANGNESYRSHLEELRKEIDKVDYALLNVLMQRMRIVDDIGRYKKENNITILQIKRWQTIIKDRLENGLQLGLSEDFLMGLLELIHRESIQRQMDIMNDEENPDPVSFNR
ncbi:MAG: bifunctional 3-deoxy-7-phosphoheptulonate synthase/chorismate mutase type II [Bacteroidetes bacterium]|nr:bifunctional 3-deoxy-7-phosphoheptulonate synthase/chorismate mutase type II [Bacteroidota bacterium]